MNIKMLDNLKSLKFICLAFMLIFTIIFIAHKGIAIDPNEISPNGTIVQTKDGEYVTIFPGCVGQGASNVVENIQTGGGTIKRNIRAQVQPPPACAAATWNACQALTCNGGTCPLGSGPCKKFLVQFLARPGCPAGFYDVCGCPYITPSPTPGKTTPTPAPTAPPPPPINCNGLLNPQCATGNLFCKTNAGANYLCLPVNNTPTSPCVCKTPVPPPPPVAPIAPAEEPVLEEPIFDLDPSLETAP